MPEFVLVESSPEDGEPDPVLWRCPDCAAGRVQGRSLVLSIDEGVAGIGCPVENCSGLDIDSEMLQTDGIAVTLRLEKSGGTYEYPNDCDVWFVVEPAKE